jgi:protocatechuate 3,4-dioxygenase beta subunit
MPRSSLFAFVGVTVLLVAAWLLWNTLDQPEPATLPQPNTQAAAASSATPAPAAAERTDLAAKGQTPPAAADHEREAAAASRTAQTPATGPAARITGRLVDSKEQPRAGVTLRVPSFRTSGDFEFDMPMARSAEKAPTVTSGPDGRFEFVLGPDRHAFLEPTGDLVFAEAQHHVQGNRGNQDLGNLVVLAGSRVSGVVRDGAGRPVAGAKVTAYQGAFAFGSQHVEGPTGSDGAFAFTKLRPGTYELRTASAAYLPASQQVMVAAEQTLADVVLTVQPGQAISGQVVDDRGVPIAGAKVGSKRKETRGGVEIERFTQDEAAATDAHGYFTLAGLDGAAATVRASAKGHAPAVQPEVRVGSSDLLLRLQRHAVIEGVLVSGDGAPLAGSRVSVDALQALEAVEGAEDHRELMLPFAGRVQATTAADGAFRLEGVPPGKVVVEAEGKGHRPVRQANLEVAPAQHLRGVRLVADRGGVVRVQVKDSEGQPIAGAKVAVAKPGAAANDGTTMVRATRSVGVDDSGDVQVFDGNEPLGMAQTDAEGLAVVAGLPAGPAEVRAEHERFAPALPAAVVVPAAGAVEAQLQLRTPGFVAVQVHDAAGQPVANIEVRLEARGGGGDPAGGLPRGLRRGGGESKQAKTDASGRCRFGPLLPGDYRASLLRAVVGRNLGGATFVFGGDEGEAIASSARDVIVAGGATAELELLRPTLTRLTGTVTGASGPVAGCVVELAKADAPASGMLMPDLGGGRSVTAGSDGVYAFDDVEAGRYTLRYGRPEAVVMARAEVAVAGEAEQRCDLALRTGSLRIQAWDRAAAAPLAGVEVTVREAAVPGAGRTQRTQMMVMSISTSDEGGESSSITMGGQRVRTGADGFAELADVPPGTYDVHLEHGKFAPGDVRGQVVVERQVTECPRAELGAAGRVRGKVMAADGSPVRMALVRYVARDAAADAPRPEPVPSMGGAFTCKGLAPGKYTFKAQEMAMGPGGPGAPGPEVEVVVVAGETATVELRLPPK